ncbi:MAG TPA: DUF1275 family protein [Terricaulis sp.]|nr:DUF1275 family protein [Terricaulis sp.]
MIRYKRRFWALAAALAALAGFVDSIAFIQLGGYFVSFMSGNSTRLAVGISQAPAEAWLALGLIAAFMAGVIAGALVNRSGARRGGALVLALVTVLLCAAAMLGQGGAAFWAMALLAAAMGVENAVFLRDGEVSIGVTYMTGALVRMGQRIAGALTGGPAFAWAPYLILWLGLIAGAALGAIAFVHFGFACLWFAAAAAALLGVTRLYLRD